MFTHIEQIAEGFYNDFAKKENELYESRIKICKECPLYTESKTGPKCDFLKTYNGIRGCGCFLNKKTRVKSAKCVLGKW